MCLRSYYKPMGRSSLKLRNFGCDENCVRSDTKMTMLNDFISSLFATLVPRFFAPQTNFHWILAGFSINFSWVNPQLHRLSFCCCILPAAKWLYTHCIYSSFKVRIWWLWNNRYREKASRVQPVFLSHRRRFARVTITARAKTLNQGGKRLNSCC